MLEGGDRTIPALKNENDGSGGLAMNANANYLGFLNLLRALQDAGIINQMEARRIAARLKVETGADIIFWL